MRAVRRSAHRLASGQLVQYISVGDMRSARDASQVLLVNPKGAQEGFEQRINWPAVVASAPGEVVYVSPERIQYRRARDGRVITLRLRTRDTALSPLVEPGDRVVRHQVIAAVVPVASAFACPRTTSADHYIEQLSSLLLSERYAAAKALQRFRSPAAVDVLARTVSKGDEHLYVRLEAAASLARQGSDQGWDFLREGLADPYLQTRLEAVIVLGEIQSDTSVRLLAEVLRDKSQHAEIRAGAAWALGELRDRAALATLVESFAAVDEIVRVEAARALAKLAVDHTPDLVERLPSSTVQSRPGIAWAIGEAGQFGVRDLLGALVDEDARHWVSYILGTQDPSRYVHEIEQLRRHDPEVYLAVTVLWKIMSSWVHNLEAY